MARVITNDQIYDVLGSIDTSMRQSLTLMKDSLAIDEKRASLAKESAERAKTSAKLDALDADSGYSAGASAASGTSPLRSGLANATSGGIFGGGNMLKLGLAAAAAPFALKFLEGFLFGDDGVFAKASDYLSTEGLAGVTSKLGEFLNNELTGTVLGTLVFGKKFLLFTLAQKAVTNYIEDKFGVDIPDWMQGPAGTAMSIIAASIIGAGAKRALFAVGGAALAGTLKLGKKGMTKVAITAASAVGAKQLAEKLAAKEAAEAAEVAAFKRAAKYSAANVPVGKLSAPEGAVVKTPSQPKYNYDPKTDVYTSKKTGKELTGPFRATSERHRLANAPKMPTAPMVDTTAAKILSKLNPIKPMQALIPDAVSKLALKSLPFAGALLGGIFAAERLYAGDTTSAALNATAAGLDLVPGVGTAASISTDVASALTEVFHGTYGVPYNPKDKQHQEAMVEITKALEAEMAKKIAKNPQLTRAQTNVSKADIENQALEYSLMSRPVTSFFNADSSSIDTMYPEFGGQAAKAQFNLQQKAKASRAMILEQNAAGGFGGNVNVSGGTTVNKGGDTINNTTISNTTVIDPAKSLNSAPN